MSQKKLTRRLSETARRDRPSTAWPARGHPDLEHAGQLGERPLQAGRDDVGVPLTWHGAAGGQAHERPGQADHRLPPDRRRRLGQRMRALSERNAMASGCSSTSARTWPMYASSLSSKLFAAVDGGMAPRPQPSMTGLEEMQGQLLLAGEVLVERRIRVAALPGDVTNARAVEPSLAEQLHRRAEDLSLGRGVVLANVEGKRLRHLDVKLAYANLRVKPTDGPAACAAEEERGFDDFL